MTARLFDSEGKTEGADYCKGANKPVKHEIRLPGAYVGADTCGTKIGLLYRKYKNAPDKEHYDYDGPNLSKLDVYAWGYCVNCNLNEFEVDEDTVRHPHALLQLHFESQSLHIGIVE